MSGIICPFGSDITSEIILKVFLHLSALINMLCMLCYVCRLYVLTIVIRKFQFHELILPNSEQMTAYGEYQMFQLIKLTDLLQTMTLMKKQKNAKKHLLQITVYSWRNLSTKEFVKSQTGFSLTLTQNKLKCLTVRQLRAGKLGWIEMLKLCIDFTVFHKNTDSFFLKCWYNNASYRQL